MQKLDTWDETDLDALLTLEKVGPMHYRNRYGDPNENGRSYGGQLLAHALMAASETVPEDRAATAMQLAFLQGALHDVPLDLHVTVLQDGKRFSSRHVRGTQPGGRIVLDAHVSYSTEIESPDYAEPSTALESPETLPRLSDVPPAWGKGLERLGAYSMDERECFDFRLPDAEAVLSGLETPRVRFWMKPTVRSTRPRLHEGAFAYISDWWVSFPGIGIHARGLAESGRRVYTASLNHSIWFHRPCRDIGWLHFDAESAITSGGRSLSFARVHDEQGRFVASVSQDCLVAYA